MMDKGDKNFIQNMCSNHETTTPGKKEKNKTFHCSIEGCSKKYVNRSRLNIHLRTHVSTLNLISHFLFEILVPNFFN